MHVLAVTIFRLDFVHILGNFCTAGIVVNSTPMLFCMLVAILIPVLIPIPISSPTLTLASPDSPDSNPSAH